MRIAWRLATRNWSIASLRIRFWLPYTAIKDLTKNNFYLTFQQMNIGIDFDVIIFVKVYSDLDVMYAKYYKQKGARIIYDLCDNIFHMDEYYRTRGDVQQGQKSAQDNENALKILRLADVITVSSDELKDVLVRLGLQDVRIRITRDVVDTSLNKSVGRYFKVIQQANYLLRNGFRFFCAQLVATLILIPIRILKAFDIFAWKVLCKLEWLTTHHLRLAMLSFFLVKTDIPEVDRSVKKESDIRPDNNKGVPKKRIIWFGNAGRPGLFGMTDLLAIRNDLEAVNAEIPIELCVVSNNMSAYIKYIRPFKLATRYVEWNASLCDRLIQGSSLAVLPNSDNSFSACKSPNRTILALQNSCPVVASKNQSLSDFRDCVLVENWQDNIKKYLLEEELKKKHVSMAQKIISDFYTVSYLRSEWKALLGL